MQRKTTRSAEEPITGKRLREAVHRIAKEYGVQNVRVFGSFARGEQKRSSDIDLLITAPDGMTLFDLVGLKIDLEEACGRTVDVIPDDSIKPALRRRILSSARAL